MNEQETGEQHTIGNADAARLTQAWDLIALVTDRHSVACECDWCQARELIYVDEEVGRTVDNVTWDQDAE